MNSIAILALLTLCVFSAVHIPLMKTEMTPTEGQAMANTIRAFRRFDKSNGLDAYSKFVPSSQKMLSSRAVNIEITDKLNT